MSAMNPNKWQDIPGVDISIPGRGESIVYRESGREYHFDISCAAHPLLLFTGSYWDGVLPVTKKHLTEDERQRLVPRLVAYLGCKDGDDCNHHQQFNQRERQCARFHGTLVDISHLISCLRLAWAFS